MAKSTRKASSAKPITAHPLFPAVVALWFGALFGLGSLAVRPSLLESVVIASRIDLLIPAAAPPLGLTARILVALGMAALGGALGLLIARRITRPKVEVRQRKRTGVAREDAAPPVRARDAFGDAAARQPISVDNGYGADDDAGAGALAGRRRPLAVELPEEAYVPHEMAPLPGGAPQIFSISELELDAGMTGAAGAAEPVAAQSPLDLGRFAQSAEPAAASAPAAALPLDLNAPAPVAARQEFVASPDAAAAAPVAERQIFGASIVDDHVAPEFVRATGFKTSVFEVEAAVPLFQPGTVSDHQPAAPVLTAEPPNESEPAAPAADSLPPLGTLGMTELAARLAESMRRRRAARAAAALAAAAPAAVPEEPGAGEAVLDEPLVAGREPYTPFAQYAPTEPIPAPFARSEPAPAPEAFAEAELGTEVAPVAAPESAPLPRLGSAMPVAAAPLEVPPATLAMPAALRPLTLDEPFADDDDDVLASLLPPRHLAMPATSAATPVVAEAEAALVEDEALGAEDKCGSLLDLGVSAPSRPQFVRIEEPDAERAAFEPVVIFPGQAALGAAATGSYAPAMSGFAPAPAPAPFSAPADSAPFRQFDAPSAVGAGQPIVNPAAAATLDPEETERALRAALANLQRMSGAA